MNKGIIYLSKLMLVVVFVLSGLSYLYAEKSETAKYLMSEPLTMFDWGLYRLERSIKESSKFKTLPQLLTVTYDWDSDKIKIEGMDTASKPGTAKEAEKLCGEYIKNMKMQVGVDPETGKGFFEDSSVLLNYFTHNRLQRKSLPENLGEELDNMTVLHVIIFLKTKEPKKVKMLRCESPLLGTDIKFFE